MINKETQQAITNAEELLSILDKFGLEDEAITRVKKLVSDFKKQNNEKNLEKIDVAEVAKLNIETSKQLSDLKSLVSIKRGS